MDLEQAKTRVQWHSWPLRGAVGPTETACDILRFFS